MTLPPKDAEHDPKKVKIIAIVLGLVAIAMGIAVFAIYGELLTALADNKEASIPDIETTFTDRNQTREELIAIIENQRSSVYSGYALEYAFCQNHLGETNQVERRNISLDGSTIKVTVVCYGSENNNVSYIVTYDYITNQYDEAVRAPFAG